MKVIKGTESVGTPDIPEYTDGNILEGATLNHMPLYKVTIEGVVLSEIEPLFDVIPTYKTLAEQYKAEFIDACASHLDSLDILDTMEEVDANTQENQIAGALALKEMHTQHLEDFDELSSCVNPENLIPYPYYETTHTDNGITWTDNGDGTVTANGTATGASVFYMVHNTSEPIQAEKCKYTLNGCPSGGSSSKYAVRLYESTKSLPILCTDIGAGAVFDNSNGNILGIATACVIYKGTTVENLTFKPMLVKGSHKCPYNPYSLSKAKLREDVDALNSSLTKQGSYELLTSCYTATSYEVPNISKFKSIYVALIMTSTNICADDTFMPVSIFKLGKTRQLNINYETYKYGNIQYVDDTTIKVSDISDGMYLTVWGVY